MQSYYFCDPMLTANLYLAGRLDEALLRIVAPFWRAARTVDPEDACYLWTMRYGKGGEHLKLRLHGPQEFRPALEQLLLEFSEIYMSTIAECEAPSLRQGWRGAPSIDEEDDGEAAHPDRSLLLTRYRRSNVSLGGAPFLHDDPFAARLTTCLARGCELVLAIQPNRMGTIAHSARQNTLLKAWIGGLAALGFSPEKRAQYLAYHRDWLVRFLLPKGGGASEILDRFAERIAAMGSGLEILGRFALSEWPDQGAPVPFEPAKGGWQRALRDLLDYVAPYCSDPDYHLDPYAADPAFSPLFKAFHGLANQLGLGLAEEGFACHALLEATAVGGTEAVQAGDAGKESVSVESGRSGIPPRAYEAARSEPYPWHYFVARSGDPGRRWMEQYGDPEVQAAEICSVQALALLRRRQLAEGRERLAQMAAQVSSLNLCPSVLYVLERWYYGVLSYYHYSMGDFDRAEADLLRAAERVVAAMSLESSLLPLANHCHEFRLHQVRIARNRRRWQEMTGHVEVAQAMVEDRLPLCVLADGRAIGFRELALFHDSIPDLTTAERSALAGMLDPSLRLQLFRRLKAEIDAFPGFVIPYRAQA